MSLETLCTAVRTGIGDKRKTRNLKLKILIKMLQVMSHIVCAIGCEAARARDDWETALLCTEAEAAPEPGAGTVTGRVEDAPPHHHQDNYCFEMLSLVSMS